MPNWKKVIVSGSDAVLNNITATGNVTVQGDIIAENYIVSSSVTYMTQSFSSGSTVFGDSLDPLDTHQFTGSLFITGITYDDTPVTDGLLAIDNATGKLYYTGSYGDAGGGITITNDGLDRVLTSNNNGTINAETNVTITSTAFNIGRNLVQSTTTGRAIISEDSSGQNRIQIGDIQNAGNRTLLDVNDNTSERKISLTTYLGNTGTTWTSYFHTGSIFLSGALTVSADDGTKHEVTGSIGTTSGFVAFGGNIIAQNGTLQTPEYLSHYLDTNTYLRFPSNDTIHLTAGGTNVYTMKSDRTTISVPITASSAISASGFLYANAPEDVDGDYNPVVVYDTTSGQFYYTGSYGSGGGTPGGDRTYVQYSGSSGFDGDSGFTYGPQTNTLRVGTSAPQSVGAGYGFQSGSHFLADNLELVSNARVVKWNQQSFQSENYVLVGFGQGGTIVTDPYSGNSYNPGDVGDWLGAADGNNQSPILSGLSGGQGNFADITGKVVNGSLKIGGVYANYRSDVGWSVYANQFTQVPGSPGITIRNGGIELFSSESYVGDPEGSGSLAAPRASASAVFTLANDSSSLLLQVGKEDLRDVMFISRSGDNPRIGIGTDNPLTNFDFKDISDSNTGTKMILRSSRPTKGGDNGDEAGKINFVIDSSSYGDIETSGSVAKILGSATSIGTDGASGKLSFEVADANNPKEDTTEVFYLKRNSTDLQNIVGVFEGSIDLNGANSSLYADKDVSVGGNVEAASGYVRADSLRIGTSNDPGGDSAIIQGNLTTRGDTTFGNSSDDIHTFTGNITASNDVSASGDIIANNGSFSGDLTVDGNITANQYIVSSSVTYMTQSFSSGSTIFGDTLDDTHQFTGSVDITGSFTVDGITFPIADGDNGDTLITDGAGNLSFNRTTVYANVKNVSGVDLVKGYPVHVTGTSGNASEIIVASASNAATMPAHFILNEDINNGAEGQAIAIGFINGVNTVGFGEGDTVYVGADGGYTNVKPTGSNLIQNLGIVTKVATNGSGFILGAGRSNDVPNISPGYAWVGNNSSVATAVATSSLSVATASFVGSIHGGTF